MTKTRLALLLSLVGMSCGPADNAPNNAVVIVNNTATTNNATIAATNNGTTAPNNTIVDVPLTVEEFIATARRTYCEVPQTCPNAATLSALRAVGRYATVDECLASAEVTYSEIYRIAEGVAAGRIAYNADDAAKCLEDSAQAMCDGRWGRVLGGIPSCAGILSGTVAPGQTCASFWECDGGYCDTQQPCATRTCVSYGTTCGAGECDTDTEYCERPAEVCRPRKAAGSTCDYGQCQTGNFCTTVQGGTCAAWAAQGAGRACVIDLACETSLVCEDSACAAPTFGTRGDACSWKGAAGCEPGLVCRVPEGGDVGVCGAPLLVGESCRTDSACAGGLHCDVWNDDTCQPDKSDGAACQSFAQCASRSCPGGMGSAADGTCEPTCSN